MRRKNKKENKMIHEPFSDEEEENDSKTSKENTITLDDENIIVKRFPESTSKPKTFKISNLLEFGIPKSRFFKFKVKFYKNFSKIFLPRIDDNELLNKDINNEYEYVKFTTISNKEFIEEKLPDLKDEYYKKITLPEEKKYTQDTLSGFAPVTFDFNEFKSKIIQIIEFSEDEENLTLISVIYNDTLYYGIYKTEYFEKNITTKLEGAFDDAQLNLYETNILRNFRVSIKKKLFSPVS